jgi:hypothetical protein
LSAVWGEGSVHQNAGMLLKKLGMPLLVRFGYRRILIINTFAVGALMASFAFFGGDHPQWLSFLQLSILRAANSLPFTAMNTVSLKDLDREMARSGSSLLSMV